MTNGHRLGFIASLFIGAAGWFFAWVLMQGLLHWLGQH